MTRKERATVQGFINKLSELDKIEHETLETLKDMCETYGDGNRWCSWRTCLDKIAEASGIDSLEYRRAEVVYERFIKASAQMDLIRAFGGELAEIGFWKNWREVLSMKTLIYYITFLWLLSHPEVYDD